MSSGNEQSTGTSSGKHGMSNGNERRACEFHLLRYVPDAVRNEFVHIGVILREQGSPEAARVQFTRDWRRVRCLDPEADTALLEGMESELRRRFAAEPDGNLMRLLKESLSLSVQMTEAKAYLAESIPAGVEELMRLYVDPPPRERVPRLSGRAAIQARMRSEFERAGVWDLLRKRIAASEYTRPGDPLKIDVGYRPNGLIRMFHAVSLEPGVEMAKVLAFSAAGLRAGVERVDKAQLELTAVIEPAARLGATDEEPERLEMYRFGVETMEEHQIRVLTTSDLERVAETARRELRI
ncbi:MAG TPA: DUF3037 domain-containing protein [Terracidiphilus sp.]|nr:DUF3037 domain-containing protein [Terracidiphilus sp.]